LSREPARPSTRDRIETTMDLILGTCVAYGPGKVRPFFESLRRHYAGTVVMITAHLPR
jgi:hypothetical protein